MTLKPLEDPDAVGPDDGTARSRIAASSDKTRLYRWPSPQGAASIRTPSTPGSRSALIVHTIAPVFFGLCNERPQQFDAITLFQQAVSRHPLVPDRKPPGRGGVRARNWHHPSRILLSSYRQRILDTGPWGEFQCHHLYVGIRRQNQLNR